MKASYKKETLEDGSTPENRTHSPAVGTKEGNRFIKKGESRECFYFGVARKLIGDKWSLLIMFILRDGSMRFNALLRGVEGISQKVLAATVRELERDGYIRREVINTSPPCVQYSLTTMGKDFLGTLTTISRWIESNWPAMEESRREFDSRTGDLKERPQASPRNHLRSIS